MLDVFIEESINNGVLHFHITVLWIYESEWVDSNDNKNKWKKNIEGIVLLLEHLKLTAFYYISIELNEKLVPHLHIILGLKSIIGYNDIIHKNIKKFF